MFHLESHSSSSTETTSATKYLISSIRSVMFSVALASSLTNPFTFFSFNSFSSKGASSACCLASCKSTVTRSFCPSSSYKESWSSIVFLTSQHGLGVSKNVTSLTNFIAYLYFPNK